MYKLHLFAWALLAAVTVCAADYAQQKRPSNNQAASQPAQVRSQAPQQGSGCACACGRAAASAGQSPGAVPAGQDVASQLECGEVTTPHKDLLLHTISSLQPLGLQLPSSWPPSEHPDTAAGAAGGSHPSRFESRVVAALVALVAAVLLYLLTSHIYRHYKRQWLKKLRRVPGFSAVSDGSQQSDLIGLIDMYISTPVFQCIFITGAATVGFVWPHWDWMVLLVVILQHALLRLLGFATAAACFLGHAAAQSLWQFVGRDSSVWVWCSWSWHWLGAWVKHGDVAVLVTADSLDSTACPELDEDYRAHSTNNTSSSCTSCSPRTKLRSRKHKANKCSSSVVVAPKQVTPQSPGSAGSSDAVPVPPKASSAVGEAVVATKLGFKQEGAAKPAAAVAAPPSKRALTQTICPLPQQHAGSVVSSPDGPDAQRRSSSSSSSSSGDSSGTRDQLASTRDAQSSGSMGRKDKSSAGCDALKQCPLSSTNTTNTSYSSSSGTSPHKKAAEKPASATTTKHSVTASPAHQAAPALIPAAKPSKPQLISSPVATEQSFPTSPVTPGTPGMQLRSPFRGQEHGTPTATSTPAAAAAAASTRTAPAPPAQQAGQGSAPAQAAVPAVAAAAAAVIRPAIPSLGYLAAAAAAAAECGLIPQAANAIAASQTADASPLQPADPPAPTVHMPPQQQQQQQQHSACLHAWGSAGDTDTGAAAEAEAAARLQVFQAASRNAAAYSLFSESASPLQAALAAAAAAAAAATAAPDLQTALLPLQPRPIAPPVASTRASCQLSASAAIAAIKHNNSSISGMHAQGRVLSGCSELLQWPGMLAGHPAAAAAAAAAAPAPGAYAAAQTALGGSCMHSIHLQPAAVAGGAAGMVHTGALLQPMLLSSACHQQQQQVLMQQLSEAQLSYSAGVALLPGDLFADEDGAAA